MSEHQTINPGLPHRGSHQEQASRRPAPEWLTKAMQTASALVTALGFWVVITGKPLGENATVPRWYGLVEIAVGVAMLGLVLLLSRPIFPARAPREERHRG